VRRHCGIHVQPALQTQLLVACPTAKLCSSGHQTCRCYVRDHQSASGSLDNVWTSLSVQDNRDSLIDRIYCGHQHSKFEKNAGQTTLPCRLQPSHKHMTWQHFHCQPKLSKLVLIQSGTYSHTTVDTPSFSALRTWNSLPQHVMCAPRLFSKDAWRLSSSGVPFLDSLPQLLWWLHSDCHHFRTLKSFFLLTNLLTYRPNKLNWRCPAMNVNNRSSLCRYVPLIHLCYINVFSIVSACQRYWFVVIVKFHRHFSSVARLLPISCWHISSSFLFAVSQKTPTQTFYANFGKLWPIFTRATLC